MLAWVPGGPRVACYAKLGVIEGGGLTGPVAVGGMLPTASR